MRSVHSASGEKANVLVVEDDYTAAQNLCDVVRDSGFGVASCVPHIKGGMACLDSRAIDAAIVDVRLAGIDVYPLCVELERRRVPFLFLSGAKPDSIPIRFRHVPFLQKPAAWAQVHQTLSTLLDVSRQPEEQPEKPKPTGGNLLLDALDSAEYGRLKPLLRKVHFSAGQVLAEIGDPSKYLFWPGAGAVSLQAAHGDSLVEIAVVGAPHMLGSFMPAGEAMNLHRAVVAFDGWGWEASLSDVEILAEENSIIRRLIHDGLHRTVKIISERACSAAYDTTVQRVARWLSDASECLRLREYPITHSAISEALLVRRASVTVAIHQLEGNKLLRSTRNLVALLDPVGLRAFADGNRGA